MTLRCGAAVAEGSRFQNVTTGLRITNITTEDDGEYTCRAEVDDDGRYDERKINVTVHSKSVASDTSSPPINRLRRTLHIDILYSREYKQEGQHPLTGQRALPISGGT